MLITLLTLQNLVNLNFYRVLCHKKTVDIKTLHSPQQVERLKETWIACTNVGRPGIQYFRFFDPFTSAYHKIANDIWTNSIDAIRDRKVSQYQPSTSKLNSIHAPVALK